MTGKTKEQTVLLANTVSAFRRAHEAIHEVRGAFAALRDDEKVRALADVPLPVVEDAYEDLAALLAEHLGIPEPEAKNLLHDAVMVGRSKDRDLRRALEHAQHTHEAYVDGRGSDEIRAALASLGGVKS